MAIKLITSLVLPNGTHMRPGVYEKADWPKELPIPKSAKEVPSQVGEEPKKEEEVEPATLKELSDKTAPDAKTGSKK
ncbi:MULTISPECIES: hypothetical protein [unclassified Roseobacter]|uniref:hypothetical protein n=1 Tax=unclassified Roseobacter TaxID=196798 RepID=UPI001491AD1C|nr:MULTISPECIES: hypothetical protein [unclassified Roseobacter]NNW55505.1 hypothetical protein [Roseobacter sp. HKCCD8284]NNY17308.1 hypothetical protein [Roseobacter sp. HKCCD8191]